MSKSSLTKNVQMSILSAAVIICTTAHAAPLSFPPVSGPIASNPNPISIKAGEVGDIHVGGVLSGTGFYQTNAVAGDRKWESDFTNGMAFIQKNTGLLQFYVQAGGYSFPTLGTAYTDAHDTTEALYGVVPVAYVTLAPSDKFSISVGKLPTLIGSEYGFTFQNMNIQRGLLWNQENVVNHGVQANFADGPFALSVSLNDGFYSRDFNWVSALASYKINDNNTIAFSGGGNLDKSGRTDPATPIVQNNSDIYSLIYTYAKDKLTVSPYVQYTFVHQQKAYGINDDASTLGGAILGNYKFTDNISLAARGEYITSDGRTSLLYGNESDAWSVTLTPTYQKDAFFTRFEASYVGLDDEATGAGFGKKGTRDDQARFMIETGLLF